MSELECYKEWREQDKPDYYTGGQPALELQHPLESHLAGVRR
jgi:hypothetical protein